MKGLFCYDGPISCDDYGNYFGTVLNDQVFKRYFTVVDSLDIAIRIEKERLQNSKASQIKLEHVNFVKIPSMSSIEGIIRKKETIEILEQCINKADILFIRLPSFIGNIAVKLAKKMKKPYIIEMVGCPWDSLWNHSLKGKLIAPYMWASTRSQLRAARYVVYVTNSFLQRRYPTQGKSTSCSNVELPLIDNSVLDRRIEKVLSTNDKIVIGTAAAVNVRYKGQQYIIQAIARLKKEGIECEYQLVGWGDYTYLKEEAKKHGVEESIKFLGALPHKEVFSWLDNIDLYAQPSRQEGLPRALIEAMSRGCPAMGAESGGIPELLEEEYIFTNSKNNIKEICNIIKGFDKEKILSQAKRNFSEAKQYNAISIQNRREAFFKEFINGI